MADKVASKTDQTYGKVPYALMCAVPPLSIFARAVYGAIDWHGRTAFPSKTTIAVMAGCSLRQVGRALDELRDRGFISIKARESTSNLYEVDMHPSTISWVSPQDQRKGRHTPHACQASPHAPQASPPMPDRPTILSESESTHLSNKSTAKPPPPALQYFQKMAMEIIADHDQRYPNAKLLPTAKRAVFSGCQKICTELIPEWGEEHLHGMYSVYIGIQTKEHRPVNPLWFFRALTQQECHDAQIKREENAFGRRPAPARDPYAI